MELVDEGLPHPLPFIISEIPIIQLDMDPRDESVVEGPDTIRCQEEEAVVEFQCTKKPCEAFWSVIVFPMITGYLLIPVYGFQFMLSLKYQKRVEVWVCLLTNQLLGCFLSSRYLIAVP